MQDPVGGEPLAALDIQIRRLRRTASDIPGFG
jgi:hypothetical protein